MLLFVGIAQLLKIIYRLRRYSLAQQRINTVIYELILQALIASLFHYPFYLLLLFWIQNIFLVGSLLSFLLTLRSQPIHKVIRFKLILGCLLVLRHFIWRLHDLLRLFLIFYFDLAQNFLEFKGIDGLVQACLLI